LRLLDPHVGEPWWTRSRPTIVYLMQTEAHVYALAIAASTLLAFYPFLTVMLAFCRNVLHWPAAQDAIYLALTDFFAGDAGQFIVRNLPSWELRKLPLASLFLLMFTANGVFEPLEVALNRAWGVAANRSYVRNQLVSLGLILVCGILALLSLILTALNREWISAMANAHGAPSTWLNLLVFKLAAVPISMLALFLVYWILPNRKIDPKQVVVPAILVGLALEALKYINLLIWPFLADKLAREYRVFQYSATILLWSFCAAMIVLAGGRWAARAESQRSAIVEDIP
jgi:membrane protein